MYDDEQHSKDLEAHRQRFRTSHTAPIPQVDVLRQQLAEGGL